MSKNIKLMASVLAVMAKVDMPRGMELTSVGLDAEDSVVLKFKQSSLSTGERVPFVSGMPISKSSLVKTSKPSQARKEPKSDEEGFIFNDDEDDEEDGETGLMEGSSEDEDSDQIIVGDFEDDDLEFEEAKPAKAKVNTEKPAETVTEKKLEMPKRKVAPKKSDLYKPGIPKLSRG
jgi:hypothetical protein